jgi:hypothetical protein
LGKAQENELLNKLYTTQQEILNIQELLDQVKEIQDTIIIDDNFVEGVHSTTTDDGLYTDPIVDVEL